MAFIAALDVGTTSVRCFIINENCEIKGAAQELIELLNTRPGYFEIEPEPLWRQIIRVISQAVKTAELSPHQITCLSICTQRCTFLTWNHRTQEYYHNFITWKDLRAAELVDEWNVSCKLKTLHGISYMLYMLTRQNRFLAGSEMKLMNGQITPRFMHEFETNEFLRKGIESGLARIELLDSWILYKLRSGNGLDTNYEHITDITCATATGVFDPFTLNWSSLIGPLCKLDTRLLPRIVDNAYKDFGHINPRCFDASWAKTHIPIACVLSDQTASMWGSHCFNEGDVKVTMGTGAFLNLITGSQCQASLVGMYPLVAWQFKNATSTKNESSSMPHTQTTYCVEGAAHDMGTIISWAQSCGLFDDVRTTADIAESVEDSDGVYFIPAFSGLGAPVNDHKAASGFIGITPSTTRAHLVRAVLESIVFRVAELCNVAQNEAKVQHKFNLLRVDGGVSRNDFVCQLLADASGLRVERALNAESSVLGAAYMAGYNIGLWPDLASISRFRKVDRIFTPRLEQQEAVQSRLKGWRRAIERFRGWY